MGLPYNMTGFSDWFVWAHQETGGFLGNILLLVLFGVMFISFKMFSTEAAILASSFISFILSILFYYLGIGSMGLIIFFGIAMFFGGFMVMKSQN